MHIFGLVWVIPDRLCIFFFQFVYEGFNKLELRLFLLEKQKPTKKNNFFFKLYLSTYLQNTNVLVTIAMKALLFCPWQLRYRLKKTVKSSPIVFRPECTRFFCFCHVVLIQSYFEFMSIFT